MLAVILNLHRHSQNAREVINAYTAVKFAQIILGS